jgi:hypothetical protein
MNASQMERKSLLVITGSMGAGKTSVLGEASDILTLENIPHAAIDLDAFGLAHLPTGASNDAVMHRNLQCVCKNYAALGIRRFLVARAIVAGKGKILHSRAIQNGVQRCDPSNELLLQYSRLAYFDPLPHGSNLRSETTNDRVLR